MADKIIVLDEDDFTKLVEVLDYILDTEPEGTPLSVKAGELYDAIVDQQEG